MTLEARAPKLGFNLNLTSKNLIIVLMCGIFAFLFVRDGFYGYPRTDDIIVNKLRDQHPGEVPPLVRDWRGWGNESDDAHKQMDDFVEKNKSIMRLEGASLDEWKNVFTINLQRWVTVGLLVVSAGAIWRFISQMRLVVRADENTVSPRSGVVIPWDKITKVDNTRWHSYGIVEITYTDGSGAAKEAEFDDYKTEREPLLKILDLLADKAVNAEFIPKPEASPEAAPSGGPSAT